MKRYLLFAGYHYYPSGGWDDFIASYETVEEAMNFLSKEQNRRSYYSSPGSKYDWWQVVDSHSETKVVC